MIEDFYELDPYELNSAEKNKMLTGELLTLTEYHREHCKKYADFLNAVGFDKSKVKNVSDIPFFPVRMFKEFDLKSIDDSEIFKTMTSSGTTGQKVSKIYLDKETALSQQKVMVQILSSYWGKKRLPMLVIDTPTVVKNREMFTARGAAIIGLNIVSRDTVYVLNDDMSLNYEKLESFLEKYNGQRFIIFGFTFLVWEHFYSELLKCEKRYDLSQAFLMTGGGWKKLETSAVSRERFKEEFSKLCKVEHFLDHYGMVEQTGCIYAECECGHLHASIIFGCDHKKI